MTALADRGMRCIGRRAMGFGRCARPGPARSFAVAMVRFITMRRFLAMPPFLAMSAISAFAE